MPVIRHSLWNVKQCLLANIELARQRQFPSFGKAKTCPHVCKGVGYRQGGRSQDACWNTRKEALTQHSGNIDRTSVQKNSAIPPLNPRNIVFKIATSKNLEFRFEFTSAACQRLVLAGEVFHLLDRAPGLLKSADESFDSVEFGDWMATLAEEGESIKESLGRARYNTDIGFHFGGVVNEFGKPEVTYVK